MRGQPAARRLRFAGIRTCKRRVLRLTREHALQVPKIAGNKHAKGWDENEESVELDAIPANRLGALVRACIEEEIDPTQLGHLRLVEAEKRQQLVMFGKQLAA